MGKNNYLGYAAAFGAGLATAYVVAGAPAGPVMPSGLVSWWKFEGNYNDSVGTNNGVPSGGASIVNDPQRGSVLQLDGINGYIGIPSSPSLNALSNTTVSMWFYQTDNSINRNLFGFFFNMSDRMDLMLRTDAKLRCNSVDDGVPQSQTSTNTVINTVGHWHHIVVLYTSYGTELFLDGSYWETLNLITNTLNIMNDGYGMYIGNWRPYEGVTYDTPWAGMLDDIMLFNRVLTDQEILNIYSMQNK